MSWTEDLQLRDIDEAFAIEHDCKRGGCPGVLRSTRAELIRHGARKGLELTPDSYLDEVEKIMTCPACGGPMMTFEIEESRLEAFQGGMP